MTALHLRSTCLGLDVAKAKLDACLWHHQARHHGSFDNSPAGLRKLLAWLRRLHPQPLCVVLEATGPYGDLAAATLHAAGHAVSVVNPRRIKDHIRSLGQRNKTDRADAEAIAAYGRTHALDRWLPPAPELAALRALLRRLTGLEALAQAEARRSETAAPLAVLAASHRRFQRALAAERQRLQAAIEAHLCAHPALAADCERLEAIEGIGPKSARLLVAELPRTLADSRAAAAWVGVTPRQHQSGTSVQRPARIGPDGQRHLRSALYLPAVVARHKNPRLKVFADRLEANGKAKMAVVLAVLHKLIRTAFAILKHQTSYDPNHHPLPPKTQPSPA